MATMAPPLPPDVTGQQMPASLQFMQRAGGAEAAGGGYPQGAGEQFQGVLFAQQRLTEIAQALKEVSDVLVVELPALLPVVQVMAKAGSSLMKELASLAQPAPETVSPGGQPISTPAAVSMS